MRIVTVSAVTVLLTLIGVISQVLAAATVVPSTRSIHELSATELNLCIDCLRQSTSTEIDVINCIRDLGHAGSGAAIAVPDLQKILEDAARRPFVRNLAAEALGAIGDDSEPAIPALIAIIQSPSTTAPDMESLREQAVKTLGEIGIARTDVVNTLSEVARQPTSARRVRLTAVRILYVLRGKYSGAIMNPVVAISAVDALHQMLADPNLDRELRLEALETLSLFGFAARSELDYLATQLESNGEQEPIYAGTANTFAAMAGAIKRSSEYLDRTELADLIKNLERGKRALKLRENPKFSEQIKTIEETTVNLQALVIPAPAKLSVWQLLPKWAFCAIAWVIIGAIMWFSFSRWKPIWVVRTLLCLDGFSVPKIDVNRTEIKHKFLGSMISFPISFLILVRPFGISKRVRELRRRLKVMELFFRRNNDQIPPT
jgi:hypothetical protein